MKIVQLPLFCPAQAASTEQPSTIQTFKGLVKESFESFVSDHEEKDHLDPFDIQSILKQARRAFHRNTKYCVTKFFLTSGEKYLKGLILQRKMLLKASSKEQSRVIRLEEPSVTAQDSNQYSLIDNVLTDEQRAEYFKGIYRAIEKGLDPASE
jgi:hypothetical protein